MKLAHLRPLYEHPGPYASVYLPTGRWTADDAKAVTLRWRHARDELGARRGPRWTRSRPWSPTGTCTPPGPRCSPPPVSRGDGVAGLPAVAEALRTGRVETLLVAPPLRGELRFGPDPHLVGTTEEELREVGVEKAPVETAGAVLARAATATDAEVLFAADLDLPDRVGALLRFTP